MSRIKHCMTLCLSLLVLAAASTVDAATLYVSCGGKGPLTSIGAALKVLQNIPGPSTISVSGACHENVVIKNMDRLTIAASTGASITDNSGGTLDVVDVLNSSVTISGLTIDGLTGQNNDTVGCEQGSSCVLIGNTIQGGADAVGVYNLSRALIVGGVLQNTTGAGVLARGDAAVFGTTIRGNPFAGITVRKGGRLLAAVADPASLPVAAGTATLVTNNTTGVEVIEGAEFLCNGCIIQNNGGDGIHADVSAAMSIQGTALADGSVFPYMVTGNLGFGVYVGDLSSAAFHGQPGVSGNVLLNITCNSPTAVTRGAVAAAGGATSCAN